MFGLPKFGRGIGLHRVFRFADEHGIDLAEVGDRSIVVVGSNGKGSTSCFVRHALETACRRVGHFTSPHLLSVTERFHVTGGEIDVATLDRYVADGLAFHARLEAEGDGLGEFELLFLVALRWFRDRDVEAMVWEAGIGGRYDPVRCLGAAVGALTSVELEHTELLGGTAELIAYDKLDAVRPGGDVFVGAGVEAGLVPRIEAFCRAAGRRPVFAARAMPVGRVRNTADGTVFSVDDNGTERALRLRMIGAHQARNAALALLTATRFLARRHRPFAPEAVRTAIERAVWPGRLERVNEDPPVWIDVGHTPDAVRATVDTLLDFLDPALTIAVLGVSEGKRFEDIARIVGDAFDRVVVTRAYKNGMPPARLAPLLAPDKLAGTAERIEDAVALSVGQATAAGHTVVVLGGLFLAVEFSQVLRGADPKDLRFF